LPTYAGHALMSEEGSESDIELRRVEVAEVRTADPDRFLVDGCQLKVEAINCAANRPPLVPELVAISAEPWLRGGEDVAFVAPWSHLASTPRARIAGR
jgi:hypothetical protein